ncbi:MAG: hypothetical protein MPW15_25695 [Candidatus Manganitrophus sp.]|nr:hypothetical protein [Candidatus Manganitrophus sp.]
MMTVLPTPAPPNRPTLPPLANGQDQVDHLDAGFQKLEATEDLLVEEGLGGARWIGQR